MLLKYNIKNINHDKREITMLREKSVNEMDTFFHVIVKTNNSHNLIKDDFIVLKNSDDYYSTPLKINHQDFDSNTFSFSYQKYNTLLVTETVDDDYIDENSYGVFKVEGLENGIIDTNDEVILIRKTFAYLINTDETDINNDVIEVMFNPGGLTDYMGYKKVKYANNIYEWRSINENINSIYVGNSYFKYKHYRENENDYVFIFNDDNLYLMDDRFIIYESDNYILKDDIKFFEFNEFINIAMPITSTNLTDLNDENLSSMYFNEKKDELIPDIIDYEKKCFEPYSAIANTYISTLKFNLFLRDRSGSDTWSTDDNKGWNKYKMDDNGDFSTGNIAKGNGDLLGTLNFTDEDIFYQKNKVSKSFLRLSFYNSKNPFKQMLLFYSTIFLNSNELYSKYIRNIDKKIINGGELVNDNTLNDDSLSLSFKVSDRYDRNNSSEGFYLYLYPDGIDNETTERTIYMKAEFNHAGYGKTIPLMCPIKDGKVLYFDDKDSSNENIFPTYFIDSTSDIMDMSSYYDSIYIPITIKKNGSKYIYDFNINEINGSELKINLYEPKMNKLV
jgi:hypothetical protein